MMLLGNQVQIHIDVVDIERANLKYSQHNISKSISILYFTGRILLHVLYFSLISPCLNWG